MIMQPTPPPSPVGPVLSAQDRASIADGIRQGHAIQAQAQREVQQVVEQTNRELGQAGPSGNSGIVKDAGGRIVVTGPDGKTITIDPKAGLDGDQIQEMVQTALQPTVRDRGSPAVPPGVIPVVAIVFTFLFLIALVISRAIAGRRSLAGMTAALPPDAAARLARIEQAVEAVAIEVERISEAQRYSAQLLTDRLPGAGQPLPAMARTLDAPAARG